MSETVIGLDLGIHTGVAIGEAGTVPTAKSHNLAKYPHCSGVWRGAHQLLDDLLAEPGIALVAKEAMLPLAAMRKLGTSEAAVYLHAGLHAIVEERCIFHRVPFRSVSVLSVRLHFLGVHRSGDREAAKRAVIRRCRVLGYLPRDSHDDDAADALATWDYALAYFMRKPPKVLTMFGGN